MKTKTKKKTVKKAASKKVKKPTAGQKTAVYLLVDRSGSMHSRWAEAISSINSYVNGLKKAGDKSEITLAVFDSQAGMQFDVLRVKDKPADWIDVSPVEVSPRGGTPLYDAIGEMTNIAFAENRERSVIVIMTDGHENASTRVDRAASVALLDKCKKRGWEVIFLGANFDAAPQATGLHVDINKTISFAPGLYASCMGMMAAHTSNYTQRGATISVTLNEQNMARGGHKLGAA